MPFFFPWNHVKWLIFVGHSLMSCSKGTSVRSHFWAKYIWHITFTALILGAVKTILLVGMTGSDDFKHCNAYSYMHKSFHHPFCRGKSAHFCCQETESRHHTRSPLYHHWWGAQHKMMYLCLRTRYAMVWFTFCLYLRGCIEIVIACCYTTHSLPQWLMFLILLRHMTQIKLDVLHDVVAYRERLPAVTCRKQKFIHTTVAFSISFSICSPCCVCASW